MAARRAAMIRAHLAPAELPEPSLHAAPAAGHTQQQQQQQRVRVNVHEVRRLVDGSAVAVRDAVQRLLTQGIFAAEPYDLALNDVRELSMQQFQALHASGLVPDFQQLFTAPLKFLALAETLMLSRNYGLCGKFGVHFGLFCLTLEMLGDEQVKETYLRRALALELRGCFAMTELGHGSNVRAIETEARYDLDSGEFVIHTPSASAQKMWIGGSAKHGTIAVVWAQLIVHNRVHGPHAFVVELRDPDTMQLLPGVHIKDVGAKQGVHGIDNGHLWFSHVRVPRANMLTRLASVSSEGLYTSSVPHASARFAAHLAPLIINRFGISCGAVLLARFGVTIAVKYAAQRRAFGNDPHAPGREMLLLDYRMHQRRLMPLLADVFVLGMANEAMKAKYCPGFAKHRSVAKEAHLEVSALKVLGTWRARHVLSECREACGALGYQAVNRLGLLGADADHLITVEGDNHVLMQQVTAILLKQLGRRVSSVPALLSHQADALLSSLRHAVTLFEDTSSDRLRDLDTLEHVLHQRCSALEWRLAGNLRTSTAEHARRLGKAGMEAASAAAWNEHILDVKRVAVAYAERHCVRVALNELDTDRLSDATKHVVRLLTALFALTAIEQDALTFTTCGILTTSMADAMSCEISSLCADVRAIAPQLVDAFGFDPALLPPIAQPDYVSQYPLWQ